MTAATAQRALDGDSDAWNALVRAYDHRVVVALVARGARPCEARECTQEAWLRLLKKQREGALTHLDLPGLAIRQARYLWLDRQRRAGTVVPIEAARDHVADGVGSEARLIDRARLGSALDALDTCSPRDRALFEAAYSGDGASQSDLAARFDLSLQRTRQVLTEVRTMLRRVLGDS